MPALLDTCHSKNTSGSAGPSHDGDFQWLQETCRDRRRPHTVGSVTALQYIIDLQHSRCKPHSYFCLGITSFFTRQEHDAPDMTWGTLGGVLDRRVRKTTFPHYSSYIFINSPLTLGLLSVSLLQRRSLALSPVKLLFLFFCFNLLI